MPSSNWKHKWTIRQPNRSSLRRRWLYKRAIPVNVTMVRWATELTELLIEKLTFSLPTAPTTLELNDTPWTNEEQQLLEQAMKTYPASLGSERWNMIADCIPNRSRPDCIKRYKHLVELVKAKKEIAAKSKKWACTLRIVFLSTNYLIVLLFIEL